MASGGDIQAFIDRQRVLLARERDAEIERSSLLLSNCGPKLLEQKGLSLGGLGIVGINIGLGGKTCVSSFSSFLRVADICQRAA
jgi:DNA polymerase alpha-associated DNA helicase A